MSNALGLYAKFEIGLKNVRQTREIHSAKLFKISVLSLAKWLWMIPVAKLVRQVHIIVALTLIDHLSIRRLKLMAVFK